MDSITQRSKNVHPKEALNSDSSLKNTQSSPESGSFTVDASVDNPPSFGIARLSPLLQLVRVISLILSLFPLRVSRPFYFNETAGASALMAIDFAPLQTTVPTSPDIKRPFLALKIKCIFPLPGMNVYRASCGVLLAVIALPCLHI